MSFHHVLLTFAESPNAPRCVFSDLSEQELKIQFVAPYRKGKDFLCGTKLIRIASIKSLQIICTNKSSEEELALIQRRSLKEVEEFNRQSRSVALFSPGRGYNLEDIVEAGADVTAKYITGPPGYGQLMSLTGLLNNQWVVAIGTGLIIAALVWWFGWA